MASTYFEQEATRLLAERGAHEHPRELRLDIADRLEKMYNEGERTARNLLVNDLERVAESTLREVRRLKRNLGPGPVVDPVTGSYGD